MKKKIKKLIKKYEVIIGYTHENILGNSWITDTINAEDVILQAKEKIHTLELVVKDLKTLL